jgi:cellulose synthase/poly-beta-1,6-N-acetylglucosamine synthase-like glycosyltransferase
MLATTLLVLASLYLIALVIMAFAVVAVRYPVNAGQRPKVSIVVAARNEERNIRRCLDSLCRLDYPVELLEVLLVNDRSTDATPAIVREYTLRYPFVRLIDATPAQGHLRGKTNAIAQGIDLATGEIVLMTDADCTVPAGWVRETVKHYASARIGLVPGFTAMTHSNAFEAVQALDWFGLFTVAAGGNSLGFPITAVGNNFTIRRVAYDYVGGYRGIPFSVTEDYALFRAVTAHSPYVARYPMDAGTLVYTEPCTTWRELYRQRKRWFTGGRDMEFKSVAFFSIAWILNALILGGFIIGDTEAALTAGVLKSAADLMLVLPSLIRFRSLHLLLAFPLYELYFFVYVLVFPPIVLLNGRVEWKDRTFSRTAP